MVLGQWLRRPALLALAFLGAGAGPADAPGQPASDAGIVLVGAVEGAIGPATVRHVEKLVAAATDRHANALVLRLDTPGGLTDSMRTIISTILGSPVPVIGWVAPPGAHAASAGTYILYATHLAAMAPGTNIGAATPVQLGGMPGPPGPAEQPAGAPEKGADAPLSGTDAMTHKVTNDAVALIRSLAEMRGRNADWAEQAVRAAATLSTNGALEAGVIELIAEDVGTLLAKADGRTVQVLGAPYRLDTAGARVETVEVGTVTRLLGIVSNPNVALILMIIGVYGIVFEFLTPGMVAPGVIGAISLTLGLYSLNQLPLDYAGLALILLGLGFMVAEGFAPSFGALGLGGVAAFVIGSAMLVETDVPEYRISWWLIGTLAAVSAAFLVLLAGVAWRSTRRAPGGVGNMLGIEADVIDWSAGEDPRPGRGEGHVWAESERWRATGPPDLAPGERVRVEAMDGLTLTVRRGAGPKGAEEGEGER